MYQNFKRERIDPKHPYLPIHYGTFEQFVDVGGRKRRFLLYVPDGVRESCPGVLVLGENGKTADDLLNESGRMREWYVYVPERIRKHPEQKVPLVLAMHGYTCSGEICTGNSQWFKVAEENGFIVVHPTALYATIEMENNATGGITVHFSRRFPCAIQRC